MSTVSSKVHIKNSVKYGQPASREAEYIYNFTNNLEELPFFHTFTITKNDQTLNICQYDRWKTVSHDCFDYIFKQKWYVLFFHVFIGHFHFLLNQMHIPTFGQFL